MTSPASAWTPDRPTTDADARQEIRDLVHRIAVTVATRPDDDRLLRSIVLDLPVRLRASAALLARLRDDRSLAVVSRFGRIHLGDDVVVIAERERCPATRALAQDDPLVLGTAAEVAAEFPALADGASPLAAFRVLSRGVPAAVVVISFDDDVDAQCAADHLAVVRDLLGPHADVVWQSPLRAPAPRHLHGLPLPEEVLTPRQLTVVRHMSQGLSNRAIADRIGFSESTVRHETMAIYRAFGVGDRRTAALVARTRGLLD